MTLRDLLLSDLLAVARGPAKKADLLFAVRTAVRRIEQAGPETSWLDCDVVPVAEFPANLSVRREEPSDEEPFLLVCDDGLWDCDDGVRVARYRLVETGTVQVTRRLASLAKAEPPTLSPSSDATTGAPRE